MRGGTERIRAGRSAGAGAPLLRPGPRVVLLAAGLLLAGGCRGVPRSLPLAAVVPPGTEDFALDPLPVPDRARLRDRVMRVGRVAVVGVRPGEPAAAVLAEVFPDRVAPGAADTVVRVLPAPGEPESFRLRVGAGTILLAGADEAGRRWAAETLRQLRVRARGAWWIREGEIRDRPGFPLRGGKRPLLFEARYRANLSYEKGLDDPRFLAAGRTRFVPVLSPGGELDATEEGVARAERFFRRWHARGARRFAIEFDDVPFGLTPETRDRFGGYPRAIAHYLRECRTRLRRIDPGAVLYWLPQTYWSHHPLLPRFARDVGREGGLPPDLGLVLTGPEVVSRRIRAEDLERVRRAFGLTRKVLLYDNRGREGDHGPLRGRGAALPRVVEGIVGERGEVLNRITRLDYAWNPRAYDPDRSLLLACREIVGPAAAPALAELADGAGRLPALRAHHLYREVRRRAAPPPRAPVSVDRYLPRVWASLARKVDIDSASQDH